MPDRSDYELPAHPPAPGPVPDWPLTGVEEAGVIAQMRRDAPARGVHVIPGSVPEGVVPPSTSLTPPPEPLRLPEQAMPIARTVAGQSAPSGNLRDQLAEALTTERWGSKHALGEHGTGHSFYAPCGICQGDVDAIIRLVMPVVEAETAALRQRIEEVEDQRDQALAWQDTAERIAAALEAERDQARAAVADEQRRADERSTELLEERDEALDALADAERQAREQVASETYALARKWATNAQAATGITERERRFAVANTLTEHAARIERGEYGTGEA